MMDHPVATENLAGNQTLFKALGESLLFEGSLFEAVSDGCLTITHSFDESPFLTFATQLHAAEDIFLKEIAWLCGRFEDTAEMVIHSTGLCDPFLFVRKNAVTFIFSLDFPYSKIRGCRISYEPYRRIKKGDKYVPHTLTVTACRQSKNHSGSLDTAEIEAASDYVERRFPLRFDRPMNLATVITNRMTYVRENRIFYSMRDNPTLELDPDTLFEEIDLCAELDIEYYQVFEGVFDWVNEEKNSETLKRLVRYASEKGVKVGDYVHPGEMYCPHYNYEGRYCKEDDWRVKKDDKTLWQLCLGCDEYLEYLTDRLVRHNREHAERLICLDMLHIIPCYNEKHAHPPGDVYSQVLGLVKLMESLNRISDDYMCWTNSGNWIELMPKLAWVNQNIYLTDPHPRSFIPTLNALKYLGDCRREQMVSVHEKYLVPYRFFCNCEYYLAPRSRVSDVRMYEYSLLQSLCVTPNVCFAELRTFLERIPSGKVIAYKEFVRKWLGFIRENYRFWRKTIRLADSPGPGAVEVYAHILGCEGFLCLVNQNTYPVKTVVVLDETIGLSGGFVETNEGDGKFEIAEIYPRECLLWEAGVPFAKYKDSFRLEIPPESVRYIRISPYKNRKGFAVYGAQYRMAPSENGYRVFLQGEQGTTQRIMITPDEGERVVSAKAFMLSGVKMFTFEANAQLIQTASNKVTVIDIKFPLEEAPRAITAWVREADNQTWNLPMPGFGFQGALISGSHSELFEVCVEIETEKDPGCDQKRDIPFKFGMESDPPVQALYHGKRERLKAVFMMPFIEPMNFPFQPDYGDDCVMHLVFEDPMQVASCKVFLNDVEVEVCKYRNAAKRDWISYYVELTDQIDPGEVRMVIDIEFFTS